MRQMTSLHLLFFIGPENFRSQRAVEKIGGARYPERDGPDVER